ATASVAVLASIAMWPVKILSGWDMRELLAACRMKAAPSVLRILECCARRLIGLRDHGRGCRGTMSPLVLEWLFGPMAWLPSIRMMGITGNGPAISGGHLAMTPPSQDDPSAPPGEGRPEVHSLSGSHIAGVAT